MTQTRRAVTAALAAVAVALLPSCKDVSGPSLGYGGGVYDITVTSRGLERRARVLVPGQLRKGEPAPLLLAFHGAEGTPLGMQYVTELEVEAAPRGVVMVYPQAISGLWLIGKTETLDLQFVSDLVDHIGDRIDLDRGRIYATGFSRGALFAMKMACQRPELVAAVAPVAAAVRTEILGGCTPGRPVPAILFLGSRDRFFPWEGQVTQADTILGGVATGRWWAELNGCGTEPAVTRLPEVVNDGTYVERWVYPGCPSGGPVEFYAVWGGDHTWPGADLSQGALGVVSGNANASRLAVEFLAAQRR